MNIFAAKRRPDSMRIATIFPSAFSTPNPPRSSRSPRTIVSSSRFTQPSRIASATFGSKVHMASSRQKSASQFLIFGWFFL